MTLEPTLRDQQRRPRYGTRPRDRARHRAHVSALVAAASVILLATGCSPIAGGRGGPAVSQTPYTRGSEAPTAASTPSPTPTDVFAGVDPCALVADETRTEFALTDPQDKNVGEAQVCRFRIEGETLTSSYTVGIELFPGRGLDEVVSPDVEPLPGVGRHPAVRFSGINGGCAVSLGVGDGARVDVTAVGGDHDRACDLVTDLAVAIEATVP